ncbi:hypothetical protein MHBO_004364, partial [Bonamia ostreae]
MSVLVAATVFSSCTDEFDDSKLVKTQEDQQKEIEELQKKVDENESSLAELIKQFGILQTLVDTNSKDGKAAIESLRSELLERLATRVKELKDDIATKGDLSTLQILVEQYTTLNTKVDKNESDNKDALASLKDELIKILGDRITALENDTISADNANEIAELKLLLVKLQAQVDNILETIKNIQSDIDAINADLDGKASVEALEALTTRIEALEAQITTKAEISALEAVKQELIKTLGDRITALENDPTSVDNANEIARLNGLLEKLNA